MTQPSPPRVPSPSVHDRSQVEPSLPGRLLWAVLGMIALVLASIGLIVPIFPGLPFAILAALCFANVSRRLRARIARIPALRRPMHDWQRASHGGVRAQLAAAGALLALGVVEMLRWTSRLFSRRGGDLRDRR